MNEYKSNKESIRTRQQTTFTLPQKSIAGCTVQVHGFCRSLARNNGVLLTRSVMAQCKKCTVSSPWHVRHAERWYRERERERLEFIISVSWQVMIGFKVL